MKVLIVEDDPNMRGALLACVEKIASETRIAGDLPTALSQMMHPPLPNLVLLDLRLPGSTAENTLKHIEEFKEINPRALVIPITGMPDPSLPKLAEQLGADAFINKRDIQSQVDLLKAIKLSLKTPSDPKKPEYESALRLLEKLSGVTAMLASLLAFK